MPTMEATFEPYQLWSLSMRKVVQNIAFFLHDVQELPVEIRGPVVHLMSKRGLIKDENIGKVIY